MSDKKHEGQIFDQWRETEAMLNSVSPAMCLAKWVSTTIYLHNGFTHSCHHPGVHAIDKEEIKWKPIALHNTKKKREYREMMLRGEKPEECNYCWRIDGLNQGHFSDRIQKSALSWSRPFFDTVIASGDGEHFQPTYVEVMFESTCNFKCTYCQPEISSRIWEEIEQYGPYQLTYERFRDLEYVKRMGRQPIHWKSDNPYVTAFWKWWPDLYPTLHTFRITGGEPLLSDHTWKVLDWIIEHPRPEMVFALNTNLGSPDKLIDKLIEKLNKLPKGQNIQIFTSLEATGKQAEYIRFGMEYDRFIRNCERILNETNASLLFMTTVNALCYSSFGDFLKEFMRLRFMSQPAPNVRRALLSVNFLRHPEFLDIRILPDEIKQKCKLEWTEIIEKHRDYVNHPGHALLLSECDNVDRLIGYMMSQMPDLDRQIDDFRMYHKEYDRRRGVDFATTFPELASHFDIE